MNATIAIAEIVRLMVRSNAPWRAAIEAFPHAPEPVMAAAWNTYARRMWDLSPDGSIVRSHK